jgi:hypothetical protein
VSRSVCGGGVAGTRDRAPHLAPAQPPLACPLQPTGGDALSAVGGCQLEFGHIQVYAYLK